MANTNQVGQQPVATEEQIQASRQGIAEKSESMWAIYVRRFRKHALGKVGLGILIILYLVALFADFLSPFDMTLTDKTKPRHPRTRIVWMYNGPDGREFRPFVYEKRLVNVALGEYGVVFRQGLECLFPQGNHPRQLTLYECDKAYG